MGRPPKIKEIMFCMCCGEDFNIDTFYDSNSIQYKAKGKIPYCINCLNEIYQSYLEDFTQRGYTLPNKRALQRFCMTFDIYYTNKIFEKALADFKKNSQLSKKDLTFISYYLKHCKLKQYQNKNYMDTIQNEYAEIKSSERTMAMFNSEDDEEQQGKIAEAVKLFGAGFPDEDCLFLLEQYKDWTTRHECKNKAQEEVFKQLCFTQLELLKAKKCGVDTKDLNTTFMKQLEVAKLQPKQNKSDILAEKQTLGTLLSKWENIVKKPVPLPMPNLADIQHIGELDAFMRGHTCRTVGKKNFYSETYTNMMKKFTVNKPEYKDDPDSNTTFDDLFGDDISQTIDENE